MASDRVSFLLRWCCFPSLCELFYGTLGEFQLKSPVQGQTGMHVICQQSSDELPVGSIPAQVSSRVILPLGVSEDLPANQLLSSSRCGCYT